MDYNKAKEIAVKVCNELQPHVEYLAVFGDLKDHTTAHQMGGNPDIKNIKVVCNPKKVPGFLNSNCNPSAKPIVSYYFTQAVNSLLNEGIRISGTAYHDVIHVAFYSIDLFIYIVDNLDEFNKIRCGK